MITKFVKYNESIRSLLVGPTKEEIWSNLGYDRTFDTPEEFIEYISDNLVEDNKYLDCVYWRYEPTNEIYFEYQYTGEFFYYNYKIYNILRELFNFSRTEIGNLITNILIPKINKYINPNHILSREEIYWKNIK